MATLPKNAKKCQNKLRRWLWKSKQRECAYCGVELTALTLTVDHIIPRSKGGMDSRKNVVASCPACNNEKGNQYPWKSHCVNEARRKRRLLREAAARAERIAAKSPPGEPDGLSC